MTKPIRVLFLGHTAITGGAELCLVRLCKHFDRSKITPIVALAEDGPLVPLLEDTVVKVIVLPLDESVRKLSKDSLDTNAFVKLGRIATVASYGLAIARLAKREQIDIIHSNSLKAHFYGSIASKLSGIPLIWHVRDTITNSYMPAPAVAVVRAIAKSVPDKIVTVSHPVLEAIVGDKNSSHAEVVHDGLTQSDFENHTLRPKSNELSPVRFAMLGRLMPWKGQHIFVDAAAKVIKDGYQGKFTIIGGPLFEQEEYEAKLHEMVRKHGIEEHIEFTGHRSDVKELLKQADVLVHASTSPDPLPGTILEGQAAGLAVMGSNAGGVPEMVDHNKTGLLVEPNDPDKLAQAMTKLIQDRELLHSLASEGFHAVRRNFTIDRTLSGLESVYYSILKSRASGHFHFAAPESAG